MADAVYDVLERCCDDGRFQVEDMRRERHGRYNKLKVVLGSSPPAASGAPDRPVDLDVWFAGRWAVVMKKGSDATHVYPNLRTADHQLRGMAPRG